MPSQIDISAPGGLLKRLVFVNGDGEPVFKKSLKCMKTLLVDS
jgi:hypothetical protein